MPWCHPAPLIRENWTNGVSVDHFVRSNAKVSMTMNGREERSRQRRKKVIKEKEEI